MCVRKLAGYRKAPVEKTPLWNLRAPESACSVCGITVLQDKGLFCFPFSCQPVQL